jgi:hypothetical protein
VFPQDWRRVPATWREPASRGRPAIAQKSSTNDDGPTNTKMSVCVEDSRAQARQVHQSRDRARKFVRALL